jgi:hypothetical protein
VSRLQPITNDEAIHDLWRDVASGLDSEISESVREVIRRAFYQELRDNVNNVIEFVVVAADGASHGVLEFRVRRSAKLAFAEAAKNCVACGHGGSLPRVNVSYPTIQ